MELNRDEVEYIIDLLETDILKRSDAIKKVMERPFDYIDDVLELEEKNDFVYKIIAKLQNTKRLLITQEDSNMTFDEYHKKMDEYANQFSKVYDDDDAYEKLYQEVSEFQSRYMKKVLGEYQKTINCKAKEYIADLLEYAISVSESGSSIIDVETEEIADEIDKIIWEDIGDYLLDYEIYRESDHWCIDCMFAGYYVPYWDGWRED